MYFHLFYHTLWESHEVRDRNGVMRLKQHKFHSCKSKFWRSNLQQGSVQFISVAQSRPIICNPMDCSIPGLPVHHQLLEFTQTHVHWVSDAIQPSHPLSFPSPPALNLSIRVFSNESVLHIRWTNYWSFSFSISASSEYSGLISFGLTGLIFQWTLKSLLQHHSSKASILWRSAFFMVQLSLPNMTAGKTIALTI